MGGISGLKEAERVTQPVAPSTLGVNVVPHRFIGLPSSRSGHLTPVTPVTTLSSRITAFLSLTM
jgi:hypothetical protein